MTKISIKVKGMHCSSCETLIKDSLEEFEEVESAQVSQKDGKVDVVLKGKDGDVGKIKQIIRNEGYEVD